MNNKALIRFGLLVLLLLIVFLLIPRGTEHKHGNKYVVTTTKVSKTGLSGVKNVFLLVDPSGSMKGYLDFKDYPDAKKTMLSTISKPLDRLLSDYGAGLLVKYGLSGNYSPTNVSSLQTKMTTGAAFNGAETRLDKMISDAVEQASDSTISLLVSDMVLSYGKSELLIKKDPWLNKHNLEDLGASLHTALKGAKDIRVLMLQYLSDFNGRFYYNCTENLVKGDQYRKELMRNRPYYIMVFGKKDMLESLLDNEVFVKYENIYSSFDLDETNMNENKLTIQFSPSSTWICDNSAEDPGSREIGTIWTKADLGSSCESFEVQFDRFDIPAFLGSDYEIGDYHLSKVIKNIQEVTDASNPDLLRFKITMHPFDMLPPDGIVEFTLTSRNDWDIDFSVDKDDDVNIDSVSVLEKKTWGLSTILKNIDAAYFGEKNRVPQVIAKIHFKMTKN